MYHYTFAFFEGSVLKMAFEVAAANPLDAVRLAFSRPEVNELADEEGCRMEMYSHGRREV